MNTVNVFGHVINSLHFAPPADVGYLSPEKLRTWFPTDPVFGLSVSALIRVTLSALVLGPRQSVIRKTEKGQKRGSFIPPHLAVSTALMTALRTMFLVA